MQRLRTNILAVSGLASCAAAVLACVGPERAVAHGSDETAGYVVVPKVLVRDADENHPTAIDTLVQLTNTRSQPVNVQCYYVNANGYCGGDFERPCWENEDCTIERVCEGGGGPTAPPTGTCQPGGGACNEDTDCPPLRQSCDPGWFPSPDFFVTLTREQPIGWSAKTGLISGSTDLPCLNGGGSCKSQSAGDVLGVGPLFRGELKCVQLDADGNPAAANDLKAEATILRATTEAVELASSAYNGVGFEALSAASSAGDRAEGVLCLGDKPEGEEAPCAATYTPCPNVLIAEHFFDGAVLPDTDAAVRTSLTLVPCSENLQEESTAIGADLPPIIRVQMLVYNEFEQRFSTGAEVQCYRDTLLSDIDTIVGNPMDDRYSVFSVFVQGTLTGQTRLRGVQGPPAENGYGLLGVIEELYIRVSDGGVPVASAAYDLQHDIGSSRGDAVKLRPRGDGD
jgi:hypothetical protein